LVSFFLVEEKKDISILKLWKMHCLGQW
jgi:hypothetical protein